MPPTKKPESRTSRFGCSQDHSPPRATSRKSSTGKLPFIEIVSNGLGDTFITSLRPRESHTLKNVLESTTKMSSQSPSRKTGRTMSEEETMRLRFNLFLKKRGGRPGGERRGRGGRPGGVGRGARRNQEGDDQPEVEKDTEVKAENFEEK